MCAVVHDIFERQQKAPILRHVFVAPTLEGVRHYYTSRLKSDKSAQTTALAEGQL